MHRVERSLPERLAFCGRGQSFFPFNPWIQVTESAGETRRTSKVTIRVLRGSMKHITIAGIFAATCGRRAGDQFIPKPEPYGIVSTGPIARSRMAYAFELD